VEPYTIILSRRNNLFVLMLNDMRSMHYEDTGPVARAETAEELQALIDKEKVEPYRGKGPNHHQADKTYTKNFREGGPLEWYNPPRGNEAGIKEIISQEDYRKQLEKSIESELSGRQMFLDSIPKASDLFVVAGVTVSQEETHQYSSD
jgi:hypothetical protein